jgi:hypothetical protein
MYIIAYKFFKKLYLKFLEFLPWKGESKKNTDMLAIEHKSVKSSIHEGKNLVASLLNV